MNCAFSHAVLACCLQRIIGCLSIQTFIHVIDDNLLPNCPITRKDILATEHIFGPDVGSLKGKTVCKGAAHVDICTVDIPASLISQYREVVLAADVNPFLCHDMAQYQVRDFRTTTQPEESCSEKCIEPCSKHLQEARLCCQNCFDGRPI
jgi:hypothetical protein